MCFLMCFKLGVVRVYGQQLIGGIFFILSTKGIVVTMVIIMRVSIELPTDEECLSP